MWVGIGPFRRSSSGLLLCVAAWLCAVCFGGQDGECQCAVWSALAASNEAVVSRYEMAERVKAGSDEAVDMTAGWDDLGVVEQGNVRRSCFGTRRSHRARLGGHGNQRTGPGGCVKVGHGGQGHGGSGSVGVARRSSQGCAGCGRARFVMVRRGGLVSATLGLKRRGVAERGGLGWLRLDRARQC